MDRGFMPAAWLFFKGSVQSRFSTSRISATIASRCFSLMAPILCRNRSRSRATIGKTSATLSVSRPLCGSGESVRVCENRALLRLLVSGMTRTSPFAPSTMNCWSHPPLSCRSPPDSRSASGTAPSSHGRVPSTPRSATRIMPNPFRETGRDIRGKVPGFLLPPFFILRRIKRLGLSKTCVPQLQKRRSCKKEKKFRVLPGQR